jgi:REP element-mobilizing transposase RayT
LSASFFRGFAAKYELRAGVPALLSYLCVAAEVPALLSFLCVAGRSARAPFADMLFYNDREEIEETFHKLPHWQQGEVPIFATFRLSDSLPKEVLNPWLDARDAFLATHPTPWDEATDDLYHSQFSAKLDEYLDAGHGCCALRQPKVSQIVADRFHHFKDHRYQLWSYVIMPNHAHVLFSVHDGEHLPDILKGWKGVSSNSIHKAGLSDLNPFWQPEYFDRLIRGPEHFATVRAYIRDNPVKAYLKPGSYLIWEHNE